MRLGTLIFAWGIGITASRTLAQADFDPLGVPAGYAEGWALCQFLLHSDNPRYRQVIPTFVRLVKDDTNMKKVTERAFAGIDLGKLEADWKAWVLTAKLPWEGKPRETEPAPGGAASKDGGR